MFSQEDYGKPISQETSDLLRKYTTKDDISDAARETEGRVSRSTIQAVTYRDASLTEKNSEGIEILWRTARANCQKQGLDSKTDLSKFKQLATV